MGLTDLYKVWVNTMGLSATTLVISAFGAFAQNAAPAATATETKKTEDKKVTHAKVKAKKAAAPSAI